MKPLEMMRLWYAPHPQLAKCFLISLNSTLDGIDIPKFKKNASLYKGKHLQ